MMKRKDDEVVYRFRTVKKGLCDYVFIYIYMYVYNIKGNN